ncbi:MAG: hypothetical protein M3Y27_20640 [Acidobacteriota bacterium]|nr:hypothetical protein [Acidobacteriota bacterium]
MPSGEPVKIVKVVRRLRGGSQAFLVRASDGVSYVAKFSGNPQGNRTLINECMANHLLSLLSVATPDLVILRLDDRCEGREELYFSMDRRVPITSGLHLGSKCPVAPDTVAIFDFLPRTLVSRVTNLDDVGVVFAFDQWIAHDDKRQFIFARQPNPKESPAKEPKQKNGSGFKAWAIDNGKCFGGDWAFRVKKVYAYNPIFDIHSYQDLENSASRGAQLIQLLPASELEAAYRNIPRDWFAPGDGTVLNIMLDELQQRQRSVVECIHDQVEAIRASKNLAS